MAYKGDARGALWRRWDLHVHTPASYVHEYGDRERDETWQRYFASLRSLDPEIGVLGINDYFTIDGYLRVREEWDAGRLPNIKTVLPVVELRLDHLAGNSQTQRINYHVVFADDVDPGEIERGFLAHLHATSGDFRGSIGHFEGMRQYGAAVRAAAPADRRPSGSDARVGFDHAFVKLADVANALERNSAFAGRTLTAIGYTEWAAVRWDGGGGAVKRELVRAADFLVGNSDTPDDHRRHVAKLQADNVDICLIDGSDAHRYIDDVSVDRRLGSSMTWLKCDPTFEGLRRAIHRHSERVFVGEQPSLVSRQRTNSSRFIDSIEIRKKSGSTLAETWFDNSVDLNPGLVAIIGNQGSGKSALTDTLALAANADTRLFSFLTNERFRKPSANKATQFEATIFWADGAPQVRGLNEDRDPIKPERARYVPQRFFDLATNEIAADGATTLYDEIEKAVFSHIPPTERHGCSRFRELVALRSRDIDNRLIALRARLSECNVQIATLESATSAGNRRRIRARMQERERIIAALEARRVVVPAPPQALAADTRLATLRQTIEQLTTAIDASSRVETDATTVGMRLRSFKDNVQRIGVDANRAVDDAFAKLGTEARTIDRATVFAIKTELATVEATLESLRKVVSEKKRERDIDDVNSLAGRLSIAQRQLELETQSLSTAQRQYETALNDLKAWQTKRRDLEMSSEDPESLASLRAELQRVETAIPAQLIERRAEREHLCAEIHASLTGKLGVYRELATYVQDFLQREELTRDHYQLNFDLTLVPGDLANKFFGVIKHSGPFVGQDTAVAWLQAIIDSTSWEDLASSMETLTLLTEKVVEGCESDAERFDAAAQMLRSGKSVPELLDLLYSLTFLTPHYRLGLQGKPLEQLSPGERGILLLIFYLIVDQTDLPLIIDQPEGNLNNESIYERIVPVIKKAKERRQIIMVSHNPNIVVGCDADQIIHATIDQANGYAVGYASGAVENPRFRDFTIQKLEGTRPAFLERADTYVE
jgi:ABC-type lipoprotein export system ATPase subunit